MAITTLEYSDLSRHVYEPSAVPPPPGFTPIAESDEPSGYDARAYQKDGTNEVIIVNRGTEPGDSGDRKADLDIASNRQTPHFEDALKFYDEVRAANPDAVITTTGHSVGRRTLNTSLATDPRSPGRPLVRRVFDRYPASTG